MPQTTLQTQPVDALAPHPKNDDIYGDEQLPDDFLDSIDTHGIREPLVVTDDGTIISGHRRHRAATELGFDTVPVRIQTFETELEEWEAILDYNRQRVKSTAQLINEFETAKQIEEERAKQRQQDGTARDESQTGDSRDKAADAIGSPVSGQTLERGLNVKQQAEDGDDTAREEWEKLQNEETTITEAYDTVTDNESTDDSDDTPDTTEDDMLTCSVCGDPWQDLSSLKTREGESIPVEKLCIKNWPHDFIVHVDDAVLDGGNV